MAITINNKTSAMSGVDSITDSTGGNLVPAGAIQMYAVNTAPTGWLLCDGTAVSRTTYANLFATIVPSKGTVTITIASPAVVTLASHGFQTGDMIYLTTTGALPTGLSANTIYYVINVNSTTFRLATSAANAAAGTAINTSGSQSGTHTLRYCPYGLGDASTTFNVPNMRGRAPIGAGTGSGLTARVLGTQYGAETVTLTSSNIPSLTTGNQSANHTHSGTSSGVSVNHYHQCFSDGVGSGGMGRGQYGFSALGGGYAGVLIVGSGQNNYSTSYTGYISSDHTHTMTTGNESTNHTHTYTNASQTGVNTIPPAIGISFIIKT
jgi:microcystin-dependent protein